MRKKSVESETSESRAPTFEAALARLEEIIAQLEDSDVPLSQAIALVQEGDELARVREQQLREAEGKVLQLVERLGGVELEPVEVERDGDGDQ